jgi:hypothetical protein
MVGPDLSRSLPSSCPVLWEVHAVRSPGPGPGPLKQVRKVRSLHVSIFE